ncbi:hypothetical protein TorRG33x02_276580, partial [Trema orientale]
MNLRVLISPLVLSVKISLFLSQSLPVPLHFITSLILGLDSPNLGSSGSDHDRRL